MYIKLFEGFREEVEAEEATYKKATYDYQLNIQILISKYKSIIDDLMQSLTDKYTRGLEIYGNSYYTDKKNSDGEGFTYGFNITPPDIDDFRKEALSIENKLNRILPDFTIKYRDISPHGDIHEEASIDKFYEIRLRLFTQKDVSPKIKFYIQIRVMPK